MRFFILLFRIDNAFLVAAAVLVVGTFLFFFFFLIRKARSVNPTVTIGTNVVYSSRSHHRALVFLTRRCRQFRAFRSYRFFDNMSDSIASR